MACGDKLTNLCLLDHLRFKLKLQGYNHAGSHCKLIKNLRDSTSNFDTASFYFWQDHNFIALLNTVSGIIKRWAPPNENNTQAYINSVVQATGVTPDQRIDTRDSRFMMKLLQAIIKHENGEQPYSFNVFVQAINLAG